ncbi:MAG TPA: leucyl aminopeptidase [Acidimicrobiales bacterium]|nr:leucyl aminopeptidase [Acidimicrobiales bacterium]
MTLVVEAGSVVPDGVPARARAVLKGDAARVGESAGLTATLDAQGFSGAVGETAVVANGDGTPEFFVGFGEGAELDGEACRRAGAALAKAANHVDAIACDCSSVLVFDLSPVEVAAAVGEGAILSSYRFAAKRQKTDPPRLSRLILIGPDEEALALGSERGEARGEAITFTRELVNEPPVELTPTLFSELARQRGAEKGFAVEVHDEHAIAEMGLGGLLGVAKGSAEPPRLVRADYTPEGGAETTVTLVGKGITFDSGGLSIKPLTAMMSMKYDVAGASSVLGVLGACRKLGVKVRVVGYMPLTENMPGGNATRPGDVVRTRNGKTIEILNTDAEGRLVLADALALAAEEHPDAIVDIATLTGGIVVALGKRLAGLMANDDRLAAAVERAAERAGEGFWRLPLPSGYRSIVDSEVADMKNVGPIGVGSSLIAGLILEEFVDTSPWAHLDIAGTGWSDENDGYVRKGGTGFGVRTLLEFLEHYEPLGGKANDNPAGRKVVR